MAQAIPVELRNTEQGWQLYRGGEPYFINGAGGDHSLEALQAAGGNSVRTWDAGETTGELLDRAHALGLTVTLGIWLGHERHGFDYADETQVEGQYQRARDIVLRFRDHPALLLWGIGNEMEGFEQGDNPRIWAAVNDIAAMVKELDPNHPTMTVTTFVHGERIDFVHRRMPSIDIHGINAYGGAGVVPSLLRDGDASKPFVLTEFGPVGPWETGMTAWDAPLEATSTEKADFYRQSYEQAILASPGQALGAYAFLWGNKVEATTTWFGMWLEDGKRLAAVDTMSELWTGQPPSFPVPAIDPLVAASGTTGDPGDLLRVTASGHGEEVAGLQALWELKADSLETSTGGDFRADMPVIENAIVGASLTDAEVLLPSAPGPYRLYYTVWDEHGGAATANLPLLVAGEQRTPLPLPVYEDGFEGMPWAPSGWMGQTEELTLDGSSTEQVRSGKHSIRMRYTGLYGWVGVAWQHPPNNWGDQPGGFDLTGASALEVWARGQYGGEKVAFGVGLADENQPYPDSAIERIEDIVLTSEWQRIVVPLKRKDLSSIKNGFVVTLTGRSSTVTVYLDGIRFIE